MKILVVEDEKDLNFIVTSVLKKENYVVESCFDGVEAIKCLKHTTYDLVILDIMLPFLNGYDVLTFIKEQNISSKVLFLSAKDSIDDRILGLDLGANDYLVKPFDLKELLARVRVQLRQNLMNSEEILKIDTLILDMRKKIVSRNGIAIELTAKEFEILHYLMVNENHVISREQIIANVWPHDSDVYSNIVDVMIKNIRKKLQ